MELRKYIEIQFDKTYVFIHEGRKGYTQNIVLEGQIKDLDLTAYLDREVYLPSGQADKGGIHFFLQ